MPRQTATQFNVPVYNEPGALAKIMGLLYRDGINVTALMTETVGETGFLRFLVDREADARRLLETSGITAFQTQVFRLELPNRPGELHRLASALTEEDINVLNCWTTTNGEKKAELLLAVDDPARALPIMLKFQQRPAAPSRL